MQSVSAAKQTITLACTTSVETTGLLASILPQFTTKTGIAVKLITQAVQRALRPAEMIRYFQCPS
jgi:tungstate transport system substrate-binding protein